MRPGAEWVAHVSLRQADVLVCSAASRRPTNYAELMPAACCWRCRAAGTPYRVPGQTTSAHYDPDANRTDYRSLQLATTIQHHVC